MLIGEYKHAIDDKKRISLPAKFRKEVGKTVYITKGLDHCLYIYPKKGWQSMVDEIEERGVGLSDKRKISRHFLGSAQEVTVDSLGRILIPEHLKSFAQLEGHVVFAGLLNRIEVWNEARWNEYTKKVDADVDDVADSLNSIGAI